MNDSDLQEFFQKVGARGDCPVCSRNEWEVPPRNSSAIQLGQPKDGGLVIGGGPAVPISVVICTNCGFVRQHARLLIERKLGKP